MSAHEEEELGHEFTETEIFELLPQVFLDRLATAPGGQWHVFKRAPNEFSIFLTSPTPNGNLLVGSWAFSTVVHMTEVYTSFPVYRCQPLQADELRSVLPQIERQIRGEPQLSQPSSSGGSMPTVAEIGSVVSDPIMNPPVAATSGLQAGHLGPHHTNAQDSFHGSGEDLNVATEVLPQALLNISPPQVEAQADLEPSLQTPMSASGDIVSMYSGDTHYAQLHAQHVTNQNQMLNTISMQYLGSHQETGSSVTDEDMKSLGSGNVVSTTKTHDPTHAFSNGSDFVSSTTTNAMNSGILTDEGNFDWILPLDQESFDDGVSQGQSTANSFEQDPTFGFF